MPSQADYRPATLLPVAVSSIQQELNLTHMQKAHDYLTYTRARKKGPRLAIAEIGTGYRWPSL
jgi:hypothetical protein